MLTELDAKNDPEAQCMMGVIYLEGTGVRKNIPKAVEYLKKAAAVDNPEAMYRLACLLEKGTISESEERSADIEKAMQYYKKATIEGHLNALTDLAFLLENGKYVAKDMKEAYKLLKIAAKKNFPRALNNLGIMFFKSPAPQGNDSNDKKAFEYFQRAADQGYPKAFTNLGICYEKGRGVQKSLINAFEYNSLTHSLFSLKIETIKLELSLVMLMASSMLPTILCKKPVKLMIKKSMLRLQIYSGKLSLKIQNMLMPFSI